MFERLLRRLLWVVPSALGVALGLFYALSLVPAERVARSSPHARYRDLPLFFNASPVDVRTAVRRGMTELVTATAGSDAEQLAARRLVAIGGAGLPTLMAELDAYAPADRARVALALAPLAARMGLSKASDAERPELALRFWTQFWEASEVEFRLPAARTTTRRWIVYGDRAREEEVFRLDTFALEPLFELLPSTISAEDVPSIARDVEALAHITEREDRIGPDASVDEARACVERWRRFWLERRALHSMLTGSDRVMAFALETRFGKWAQETLLGGTEAGADRTRWRHLWTSLSLVVAAWLAAMVLGVGLGTVSALGRTSIARHGAAWVAIALLAMTPAGLGALVAPFAHGGVGAWLGAVLTLALGLIAKPLLAARARADVGRAHPHLLAAFARGVDRRRYALTEASRGALPALAAEGLLELPFALSGAFVVERAFGIDGLGAPLLRAIARGDVSGVMTPALVMTLIGGLTMFASEVVLALAMPHVRPLLVRLGGRA